ncbi:Fetuin-B [Dissostichus eleginoides]|uniref:Fetuin-B n=1 Tax=Dissostichus eleginoides TaxID=100907 RepID=A0AAD9C930_DISEL|nr:Fetuin-B [Dissostichus eleginoides]
MDKSICRLLLLLSLLSIQTLCVYGEGLDLSPIQLAPIPCNDKAVEKLSRLAVTYINEDRTDGYKFALNRIANVHLHAQGPAGNVYYLDLDVLETKCHIGSPKPWKRCDVRPFMETLRLHSVPDAPEKLQQTCPTCPLLLPADSPQAVDAARATLDSYKRQSTVGAGLGVKKITRASAQVVPVKASFVEYIVQECPEGVTERGTCQRQTVESDTETAVSCEMFKIKNADILRPVQPQGHYIPQDPEFPTFPPLIEDPIYDPLPIPSDPTLPPAVQPEPIDPVPFDPVPFDPVPFEPVPYDPPVANPSIPLSSSSSESAEDLVNQQQQPPGADSLASSSEEIGGPIAMRPPFNFRYQRRDRKKRQSLMENTTSHNPTFLSDFPSGSSPFRSCPGPARYTTV